MRKYLLFTPVPNIVYIATLIICQPMSPGQLIISLESTGIIFLRITKYVSESLFPKISLYSFKWYSYAFLLKAQVDKL